MWFSTRPREFKPSEDDKFFKNKIFFVFRSFNCSQHVKLPVDGVVEQGKVKSRSGLEIPDGKPDHCHVGDFLHEGLCELVDERVGGDWTFGDGYGLS